MIRASLPNRRGDVLTPAVRAAAFRSSGSERFAFAREPREWLYCRAGRQPRLCSRGTGARRRHGLAGDSGVMDRTGPVLAVAGSGGGMRCRVESGSGQERAYGRGWRALVSGAGSPGTPNSGS